MLHFHISETLHSLQKCSQKLIKVTKIDARDPIPTMPTSKPPKIPMLTTIVFDKYVGVPFDSSNPNVVPITLVIRGNQKKIPLKMAWDITIHKSQGLI